MVDKKIIVHLLHNLESDRAERTISTTNTDKFGQAICAFANDLPNHHQPGYLVIGAEDNGQVKGVHVTDELAENGNGKATFDLDLVTAFLVTERISHKAEAIEFKPSEGQKNSQNVQLDKKEEENVQLNVQLDKDNEQKTLVGNKQLSPVLTDIQKAVLDQIRLQPQSSYIAIGDAIGFSEKTIRRAVTDLKAYGIIKRENGKQRDKWIIINKKS